MLLEERRAGRELQSPTMTQPEIRTPPVPSGRALPFESARFLGVFEHLYEDNFADEDGYGTHYVVLAYESVVTVPLPLPDAQHARYRRMTDAELLADPAVHPNTKAYIRAAA